ncbi:MAG TPA: 50S ribosomal protein L11 methyltransferase [Thermoanaerobaculia bacterium]|nr:50S ribosomal protein L11 methyltransferase [Thermoanaerobaculia bacterium]
MIDYVLAIESEDEELVQSRLFLTNSTGSTSSNGVTEAYFDSAADRAAAMEMLSEFPLQTYENQRQDWLEKYQQSLEPLHIGKRFVIVPDPEMVPLTIVVPQEQAFGTGSHETTSLCIEILETLGVRGKRGLDVGSGSGILALAMHRLGASKVIAFDNDTDAYGALRDNRIRNGVADNAMPLFIGSVEALRGGTFDVITMNIIPEVIVPLLGSVVARMSSDARLILSGILVVRRELVIEAARTYGLGLVSEREKGEWWAGVFG